MEASITAVGIHGSGVSGEVRHGSRPYLVLSCAIRRVHEIIRAAGVCQADGDCTQLGMIPIIAQGVRWTSGAGISNDHAAGYVEAAVGNGIGAEQYLSAGIGDLEEVVAVGKSC